MVAIPESARELLATGILGHVVTLGPDGSPHVTLAWAGFDGDELAFSTFFPDQRKIEDLRRDPRVAVSFQAHENPGPDCIPISRSTAGRGSPRAGRSSSWTGSPSTTSVPDRSIRCATDRPAQ